VCGRLEGRFSDVPRLVLIIMEGFIFMSKTRVKDATGEPRNTIPPLLPESNNIVVVDFSQARTPVSDFAQQLALSAKEKLLVGGTQREISSGRIEGLRINPYLLEMMPGFNSRDVTMPATIAHIDWLARDFIAKGGVQEPLSIIWENGIPKVTNGHCRLLAVFRAIEVYGAEIKDVPTMPESQRAAKSMPELLAVQITRNSGLSLSTLERGVLYKKMRDCGCNNDEIAALITRTSAHVSQTITTLDAIQSDPRIEAVVRAGRVTASFAKQTIDINDGDTEAAYGVLALAISHAEREAEANGVVAEAGKPIKALPKHARAAVAEVNGDTAEDAPEAGGASAGDTSVPAPATPTPTPAKTSAKTATETTAATGTKKRTAPPVSQVDVDETFVVGCGHLDKYRKNLRDLLPDVSYEAVMRMIRLSLLGSADSKFEDEDQQAA
jgi:hypothetical protein